MPTGEARRFFGMGLGALAALVPMIGLWGFTVDDALISARVASHVARGLGYRWNAAGPVVDAVTPLGWPYVLALSARGGPLEALHFTKWFGAAAWLLAASWLAGKAAHESPSRRQALVLLPLLACSPLAAWSVSGMETGVVVALTTAALAGPAGSAAAAGLAAALRPELAPYAAALCVGRAVSAGGGRPAVGFAFAWAVSPALLVAAVRLAVFGSPVPLAVWAKPSGLGDGIDYAVGALKWTGAPLLVLAPWALRKIDRDSVAILLAVLVHLATLVLAGGDWMPLFRLFVPVLPALFLVAARLMRTASSWATLLRAAVALFFSAVLVYDKGPSAQAVLGRRLRWIRDGAPLLEGAARTAALDVGWVGAATPADVVDLAGLTDPSIARLPGGHTSKRIPETLLRVRRVDALVLLADDPILPDVWQNHFARTVEQRVAREAMDLGFTLRGVLELSETRQHYIVLRLRNEP